MNLMAKDKEIASLKAEVSSIPTERRRYPDSVCPYSGYPDITPSRAATSFGRLIAWSSCGTMFISSVRVESAS